MSKWMSIKKQLPQDYGSLGHKLLVYIVDPSSIDIANYADGQFWQTRDGQKNAIEVSHWQSLPYYPYIESSQCKVMIERADYKNIFERDALAQRLSELALISDEEIAQIISDVECRIAAKRDMDKYIQRADLTNAFFTDYQKIIEFNHALTGNFRQHDKDCQVFDCKINCVPDLPANAVVTGKQHLKELGVDHLVKE